MLKPTPEQKRCWDEGGHGMTDWNGWERYAPEGVWPLRNAMLDEFEYRWRNKDNDWRRVVQTGKEYAQLDNTYLTERMARARWEQENAPALEPLDFVAPRAAAIPYTNIAGTECLRRLRKGSRVRMCQHSGRIFYDVPEGSWEFWVGETSACVQPAYVPSVHAELVALRDEAGADPHASIFVADAELCKLRDEAEPWYRSTEQAREAATNMAAVMKRTWTVPLNPYDRAVIEAETGYRAQMVNAVVSQQVRAGGVDTPGTRAEAERYCAMLAGCVCDGMRATTRDSAYRVAYGDAWEGARRDGGRYTLAMRGTPLGKP